MATQGLDEYAAMMGKIAAGSLQGRQQAQAEEEENQRQQQQQALTMVPTLLNAQREAASQRMAPYEVLAPHIGQMTPAGQADFLSRYTGAAGQAGPGVDWRGLAGKLDEDHPLRPMLEGIGRQAAPALPANRPAYYGGPVPGAAGIAAPGSVPVPGAGGDPSAAPTVRTAFGNFPLEQVSDKQRAAALSRFEKVAGTYREADLDPAERQRIEALIGSVNRKPQSAEELRALETATGQLEAGSVGLGERMAARHQRQMEKDLGDYAARGKTLREGKLSTGGFRQYLRDTIDMEGRLSRYHAETAQPLGEWQGHKERLDAIDAALASKDPKQVAQAKADLADLRADIVNGQTPEQAGKETTDAMRIIGQMDPRDAMDPKKVATAVAGRAPGFAQRILQEGVRFGSGRAQRTFNELMGQYAKVAKPGTPEPIRQAWAESLNGAARVLGQKINLTADDVMNADPALAARLKKLNLEIDLDKEKIGFAPVEAKIREARLAQINASIAHTEAQTKAIGMKGKAAANQQGLLTQNARLREATGAEKDALHTYYATLKQTGRDQDRRFDVTHPRPGDALDAAAYKAYQTYRRARAETQRILGAMNGMLPKERRIDVGSSDWDPIGGTSAPPVPAAPAGRPGAGGAKRAGTGGYGHLTDAELLQRFSEAAARRAAAGGR